jgi:cytoskeletal protein RodZ
MDTTITFGSLLRQARERRQLTLSQIAERTKVAPASLALLEEGKLDELPPEVFVRGFIRSYARTVGIADDEPIGLFDEALAARRRQEEVLAAIPTSPPPDEDAAADDAEEQAGVPRRGFGLAVFVIIVLVIATITLSLFLRQPRQAGEDLSMGGGLRDQASDISRIRTLDAEA